ncbi:death-associated inhibitor of apoptosis 1-like [Sitodiplosis mosellana]|uniref:death-associated inhibitor of apoptosis 1-like n=1 Tax=Sitodiplosis mosellana TaxID=263140 RepID=UPI0024452717|nr:death-associated inhibitor of apoptosis 1-like [Sitodiplosis mosellana]
MEDNVGSIRGNAAYPLLSSEPSRFLTFYDWPKQLKQKPKQLAEAGFFYIKLSDRVICFSCGGGIHAWEDEDDPWEQHGIYYGRCEYLRLMKGERYHDEVMTKSLIKDFGLLLTEDDLPNGSQLSEALRSATGNLSVSEPSPNAVTTTTNDAAEKTLNLENKNDESKKTCRICYECEYDCAFLPCGHVAACVKCASAVLLCPICNGALKNIKKLYFS